MYKRQEPDRARVEGLPLGGGDLRDESVEEHVRRPSDVCPCLLYTSDAADERSSVDLGGRRIIKKKKPQDEAGASGDHIEFRHYSMHKRET